MNHAARLQKEISWYDNHFRQSHPLNQWPLYSQERNCSAYAVAKTELMRVAARDIPAPMRALVAPCGTCADYPFIQAVWPNVDLEGLDIAPAQNNMHVGDILNMPFLSGRFDVVISTLFFHHVADEGFAPYLRELARVLRVGGYLITMEPSVFHPVFAITRPAKRLTGNITGQVEHEHPISVRRLARECRDNGFRYTRAFPCSFAHNRIPAPLRIINRIPLPTHLAWQVGLIAQR